MCRESGGSAELHPGQQQFADLHDIVMDIQNAKKVAEKAAEVHITQPESLWHFLAALPATFEAQIFYALILGSVIGMIGHYIIGRKDGDISGSPADYFFHDNVWRSVGAVVAVVTGCITEIGAGFFTTGEGAFVGWGLVIVSGIKTGYIGDSAINKGARKEWTDAERAAKVG